MDDTGQGLTPSKEGGIDDGVAAAPRPKPEAALPPAHPPAALLSLKQAMRRARFDDAERSGVISDLRAARLARLEMLQEALRPLIAQIPADVDCFDIGIMPGANPRLFIDMIGFVEMARDPRIYTFLQDTRHGRIKLAESEAIPTIVEAATNYVARRLLERDKALAADGDADEAVPAWPMPKSATPQSPMPQSPMPQSPMPQSPMPQSPTPQSATPQTPRPQRPTTIPPTLTRRPNPPVGTSPTRIAGVIFAFFIDVLGSIAFFSILAFAGWVIWQNIKH